MLQINTNDNNEHEYNICAADRERTNTVFSVENYIEHNNNNNIAHAHLGLYASVNTL